MARGRSRIHIGAAPGVGKTYAMLRATDPSDPLHRAGSTETTSLWRLGIA